MPMRIFRIGRGSWLIQIPAWLQRLQSFFSLSRQQMRQAVVMRARAADVANLFRREFVAQLANLFAEPDFAEVRPADIADDQLTGIEIAATARADLSIPINHRPGEHQ